VLRSLFVLVIYFAILGLGIGSSYLLTLGYLWTDMFRPNNVIYPGYRFVPRRVPDGPRSGCELHDI
jgi:hypothetical protein